MLLCIARFVNMVYSVCVCLIASGVLWHGDLVDMYQIASFFLRLDNS